MIRHYERTAPIDCCARGHRRRSRRGSLATIAGLVQVSVGNCTMRPFILVGIENTERRQDMTGPTENPEDRKIAPRVGGSAAFRRFIKDELKPAIQMCGLFVMETFFLDPEVFDTYIAFDPSLWWNNHQLVDSASQRLNVRPSLDKTVYVAFGSDSGPRQPDRTARRRPAQPPVVNVEMAHRADAGREARDDLPSGRAASLSHAVQAVEGPETSTNAS